MTTERWPDHDGTGHVHGHAHGPASLEHPNPHGYPGRDPETPPMVRRIRRPSGADSPYKPRVSVEDVIKNAGEFFEGRSALHRAADRLRRKLEELGIPFAVAGGFALGAYSHTRETEDVDILVRKEDWHRFKAATLGLGYTEVFAGSKAVRDTEDGVRIEPLYTGGYPGDGKPKPITFPDPSDPDAVHKQERYPVVSLEKLVELKIAAGMTSPGRQLKDYADAVELIRKNSLPASFVDRLNPYVHETFARLHQMAQEPDQLDERDTP